MYQPRVDGIMPLNCYLFVLQGRDIPECSSEARRWILARTSFLKLPLLWLQCNVYFWVCICTFLLQIDVGISEVMSSTQFLVPLRGEVWFLSSDQRCVSGELTAEFFWGVLSSQDATLLGPAQDTVGKKNGLCSLTWWKRRGIYCWRTDFLLFSIWRHVLGWFVVNL